MGKSDLSLSGGFTRAFLRPPPDGADAERSAGRPEDELAASCVAASRVDVSLVSKGTRSAPVWARMNEVWCIGLRRG